MVFTYTELDCFWYLNLSEAQQKAFDEFSSGLEKSQSLAKGADDKFTLLRFLKARWVPA